MTGLTSADAETFSRCMSVGGVAVFPADTVYGLAWSAGDEAARDRVYALKGRAPDKPAALMVFAEVALPDLPPRTAAAVRALAPGPLTFVVGELGFRWPDLPLLAGAPVVVRQTSANRSGEPDPRTLAGVPQEIRAAADLVLDGGELPGTPSTVVDLTGYEIDGSWTILREGAVPRATLLAVL